MYSPRREHDRPLDDVFQLADVAGPAVAQQLFHRPRREAFDLAAGLGDEAVQEILGQLGNVFGPLAERGHDDLQHVQPEVQVAAERAFGHVLFQVAVRGGDHAHVDLDRVAAADALERMAFQHAEELGLRAWAHLADFVEHQRALVGRLELADLALGRAGERALLVAEQLAFQQRLGERGAVQADERPLAARAGEVDGAGDQLLADAALAANQHGGPARRGAGDLLRDVVHQLAACR